MICGIVDRMKDLRSIVQRVLIGIALFLLQEKGFSNDEPSIARNAAPSSSSKVRAALHEIFDDEHCVESALTICQRARRMAPLERYVYLFAQVFPVTAPEAIRTPTVRIAIDFTPTDPAPPVAETIPSSGRRLESGGQLISPALDLVETAEVVGKLDELSNHLLSTAENNLLAQKNRAALRVMIDCRRSDQAGVVGALDQFCKLSTQPQPDDKNYRAAELIVCESCRTIPGAAELLLGTIDSIVNRHKRNYSSQPWYRQLRSRLAMYSAPTTSDIAAVSDSGSESGSLWVSAGAMSSLTRGTGIPGSRWSLSPGRARNTVSHGDDYLYFRIPLRGSFQVECDASAFNWNETRPFIAGQWVSPIYDHQNYDLGNLRVAHPRRPIAPRLTRITDSLHMRAVVQKQRITTTVNGRVIHEHVLPAQHDPWVALRSGAMQEGWASNVRVTGNPEIPTTIEMAATAELEGWLPYSDGSVGGHWLAVDGGGLRGQRIAAPESSADVATKQKEHAIFREEAIFYHRPMLEDGTIEYDFFYREGQFCAHPALDRLCLLMRQDGIHVHWLTDGKYDRSELSPENETIEQQNRLVPNAIPLINDAWNKVRLTLEGDVIELSLNSQPIYRRSLESTNQRRFGFFHYGEQDELFVRNVRWTGTWPLTLPEVAQQELAIPEAEFLDRDNDHLSALFQHDFVTDGVSEEKLSLIHGAVDKNFQVSDQGVTATITGSGGYRGATIAPRISVEGDFDIIAEYSDFESQPSLKGSSSLMLIALFQNSTADEYFVTRRHMSHTPENQQHIVQCVVVSKVGDASKREYFVTKTVEDRNGRLRLARRGTKMYYLSAEGDSPNFRLWGSRDCSRDSVQLDGIRLLNQIHEVGQTNVVWKNLSVRAERLAGPALGESDPRLVKLNEERDVLPRHAVYDFSNNAPSETALYRWGDTRPWNESARGLPILAAGSTNWTSSGITTRQPIVGDFDFRAEVADVLLVKPQKDQGTGIFLQVDLSDAKQSQVSAIFNLTEAGNFEFDSQLRTKDDSGNNVFRNQGRINATKVSALRIARRRTTYTITSQSNPEAEERIVSQFEASDAAVAGAKILVHTGGPVGDSQIMLNSFEIYAEFYEPLGMEPFKTEETKERLFVMNVDGSNVRSLTNPLPLHRAHGSPNWSADRTLIAYDVWSGNSATSHVFIVRPDGTGTQDLGVGVLPNFSPDSRRIAFTWDGRGLGLMDRDGSNRQVVNASGRGARWSPDGKRIACSMNSEGSAAANIGIIDVITGTPRFLLSAPDAEQFRTIQSNFDWSPDGKWLCFRGTSASDVEQFAIVGVQEFSEKPTSAMAQSARLRIIPTPSPVHSFAWHPGGRFILLGLSVPGESGLELSLCDVRTGAISPFPGQKVRPAIRSFAWSPDGKEIVLSAIP